MRGTMFPYFYLIILMFISTLASAQTKTDINCLSGFQSIKDDNGQVWKLMNESCPIGQQMWSKKPDKDDGVFWVQCGVFSRFPEPWFVSILNKSISQQKIVLKVEGDKYRCLAGPFYGYSQAKKTANEFRKYEVLKAAFLRNMSIDISIPSSLLIQKQETLKLSTDTPIKHANKSLVTEKISEVQYDTLPIDSSFERDYFEVAGLLSPKPFPHELTYVSEDRLWWRATLDEANRVCKNDGMKLISLAKLNHLINDEKLKSQLPDRLPFWVSEQHAYDIAMRLPMDLISRSALYVLCDKA